MAASLSAGLSYLYLISTPIGNLEDITLRALRILKEVDIIACEDTRRTKILLDHYSIKRPLVSFHSYNQDKMCRVLINKIISGENVAVVSDSGTPGISDPGALLVRDAVCENIPVIHIPGPTAFVTALVSSGLPTNGFTFLGFLPRKTGRIKKVLLNLIDIGKTIIFYESPYRIKKTLALCREVFPADTDCVVARELTKKYEEYIRGKITEVYEKINKRGKVKGELVVMLSKRRSLKND